MRMPVTSSTADDIGILAEGGGDRRGFLAEGFTCGDPEFGAAVAAMVARPLAVFQQVEAGLRLAAIGSATATTSYRCGRAAAIYRYVRVRPPQSMPASFNRLFLLLISLVFDAVVI